MGTPFVQDPFAGQRLPPAVQAQALKLLAQIRQAPDPGDLRRALDRAEGFVLGLVTVKVLNALNLEALHVALNQAATAWRREHEPDQRGAPNQAPTNDDQPSLPPRGRGRPRVRR